MRRILTLLLTVINAVLVPALLISAYGGHVNPHTTTIPGLMLMMFPAILAANVLLLIIDLLMRRRLALLPAFAILLSGPAIWSFCPLNFFSHKLKEGERELKVMTYNVYNFNNILTKSYSDTVSTTLGSIIAEDADIVCIQEGSYTDPEEWGRYPGQTDTILARYPYRALHSNMMMWSKYPLTPLAIVSPADPTTELTGANIDVDGFKLTVFSVHLQSFGLTDDDKSLYMDITKGQATGARVERGAQGIIHKLSAAMRSRADQAVMLRNQIDSIARPNVIVAGDFNDIADCWAQRTIMGHDLRSTFSEVGCGPTITYNSNRFYFNIDHILYRGEMRPLSIKRGQLRSSDHYSVTATYAIPAHE